MAGRKGVFLMIALCALMVAGIFAGGCSKSEPQKVEAPAAVEETAKEMQEAATGAVEEAVEEAAEAVEGEEDEDKFGC